jgi:hypothetical protein
MPPVCLGACPERIELRAGAARGPLIDTDGVAARDGPLPCGPHHEGAWVFDASGLVRGATLRYPGLAPIRLP